jgi:hypothetical protein
MKTKLLGLVTVAALISALGLVGANAGTITFDYTGNAYTSSYPNSPADPTDFGTHLTGFVTLNCSSPCNGTYYLNNPLVKAFQFDSGSESITQANDDPGYSEGSYITISGGSVTAWALYSLVFPDPSNFNNYFYLESEYYYVDTPPGGPAVYQADDQYYNYVDNLVTASAYNFNDQGTWSVTPLPAALPLFATGLGAMGLLGWRRKRKNTAAIAAA